MGLNGLHIFREVLEDAAVKHQRIAAAEAAIGRPYQLVQVGDAFVEDLRRHAVACAPRLEYQTGKGGDIGPAARVDFFKVRFH